MSARCATIFTTFATTVLLLSTVGGATPHYIWNASNSVPIGLYRLLPVTKLTVTELVAVQPPDLLAAFLDLNGYLPTRRSHAQARAGAFWTNGLQTRRSNRRRRYRYGPCT